ncbi:hypothetical protein DOTSEDRAFT_67432 [Dothistroma septosporum NZE10]|uniref:Uncharacterized protein n=1 Tax=Dothistroma septosporum (strain NZE10 / CBS 128990) TaxID=675120 RepID=N1PY42_DOTSN|nr:hypothetical protein DOTSEDRAFT_67432 [Dothistroma septosporum NZE10]
MPPDDACRLCTPNTVFSPRRINAAHRAVLPIRSLQAMSLILTLSTQTVRYRSQRSHTFNFGLGRAEMRKSAKRPLLRSLRTTSIIPVSGTVASRGTIPRPTQHRLALRLLRVWRKLERRR